MEQMKNMIYTPDQHIPVGAVTQTKDGIRLTIKNGKKIENIDPDWLMQTILNISPSETETN